MKKRKWLLAVLAVALVLSASIGTAWGYFTTYASAQGGLVLHVGSHGELYEGFSEWTKHVRIQNKAESQEPVYVRAMAIGPEAYYVGVTPERTAVPLTYTITGEGWVDGGDGYWYYTSAVAPGGETAPLDVRIQGARMESTSPVPPEEGESFNVAVVYETVSVAYNEDGTAKAYNDAELWNSKLDTGRTEEEVKP